MDKNEKMDENRVQKRRIEEYSELRQSFVIFICMFDPFGKDLPVYTFKNKCS